MNRKIYPIFLAIILSLSGCTTLQPLNTSTGKPEIIITETNKKEVADAIINTMLSWDFQLQKRDEYILVFGKRDTRIISGVLLGSQYDTTPEWRITYNLVDYANGVRIMVSIFAITNPGSAFERITDFSKGSKDSHNIQSFLNQLKETLETQKLVKERGKIGILLQSNKVIQVLEGSPASKAGIQNGDIILKIDNEPISGDFNKDILRITGEPGSTVVLLIKKNDKEFTIPIIRGNP